MQPSLIHTRQRITLALVLWDIICYCLLLYPLLTTIPGFCLTSFLDLLTPQARLSFPLRVCQGFEMWTVWGRKATVWNFVSQEPARGVCCWYTVLAKKYQCHLPRLASLLHKMCEDGNVSCLGDGSLGILLAFLVCTSWQYCVTEKKPKTIQPRKPEAVNRCQLKPVALVHKERSYTS